MIIYDLSKRDIDKPVLPIEILSKIFRISLNIYDVNGIEIIIAFKKYILLEDLEYLLKDLDLIYLVKTKKYDIVDLYVNVFNPKCEFCKKNNAYFKVKFSEYSCCCRYESYYYKEYRYICDLNCDDVPFSYVYEGDNTSIIKNILKYTCGDLDGCYKCGRKTFVEYRVNGVQIKDLHDKNSYIEKIESYNLQCKNK